MLRAADGDQGAYAEFLGERCILRETYPPSATTAWALYACTTSLPDFLTVTYESQWPEGWKCDNSDCVDCLAENCPEQQPAPT